MAVAVYHLRTVLDIPLRLESAPLAVDFFFMLSGIALLVLRRRDPQVVRPFRVPLYPVLPLIFVATCAYLLYSRACSTVDQALKVFAENR